jgi:hypothetical protein
MRASQRPILPANQLLREAPHARSGQLQGDLSAGLKRTSTAMPPCRNFVPRLHEPRESRHHPTKPPGSRQFSQTIIRIADECSPRFLHASSNKEISQDRVNRRRTLKADDVDDTSENNGSATLTLLGLPPSNIRSACCSFDVVMRGVTMLRECVVI